MSEKKMYRDSIEILFDILDVCTGNEVNKSHIGRVVNLGSDCVSSITDSCIELGYLTSKDSGIEYGRGKMIYFKTTQKGLEFKKQISDWVNLRRLDKPKLSTSRF